LTNICIFPEDKVLQISIEKDYHKFVNSGKLLPVANKELNNAIFQYSKKYDLVFLINPDKQMELRIPRDNVICINIAKDDSIELTGSLTIENLGILWPLINNEYQSISMIYAAVEDKKLLEKNITDRINFNQRLNEAGGIYIFGAGLIGEQVYRACIQNCIRVLGFIDNSNIQNKTKLNTPIFKLDSIDKKSLIVITPGKSSSIIAKQLSINKFYNQISLPEFFYSIEITNQPESNYLADLSLNKLKYLSLFLKLSDEKSRLTLDLLIKHRITLNSEYLYDGYCSEKDQWFDDEIFRPDPEAVFVDGGAFDGDTIKGFIKNNPNYQYIYGFEIDPEIAAKAKTNLGENKKICIYPVGLSNKSEKKLFNSTGVMNGHLSVFGDVDVNLISIDEIVNRPVTHLKLDVEGAESLAIEGAKNQIKLCSPFMAIAVYHKSSDLWEIKELIEKIASKKYQYFLRHYTEVSFETVLYCV